jgi:hypothetical protein
MIRRVERRHCDLEPATDYETETPPQAHSPDKKSRRYKELAAAIVVAALKRAKIKLQLGPEFTQDVILERIIQEIGPSDYRHITCGQRNPESSLNVKTPEAFAIRNRRRKDDPVETIIVRPRWNTPGQKHRQDVVSVFFGCCQQAVLNQELEVTKPILYRRIAMRQIRRNAGIYLNVFDGYYL